MFPLADPSKQQSYDHLPTSDITDASSETSGLIEEKHRLAGLLHHTPSERPWSRVAKVAGIVFAIVLGVAGVFALGYTSGYHGAGFASTVAGAASSSSSSSSPAKTTTTNCTDPYFRREWRSLSEEEKQQYFDAFQCFIDEPSMLGMNGSLYNDFSWVHNLIAHSTHSKAPFLTWHRRFLWVYEQTLRNKCGYKGAVPFWDWTLDWEDPTASPIFGKKLAFGTDGDPSAPTHEGAHCVTDHPFKNLKPLWYGEKYEPHCLSRLFNEDWFAHYMNPGALEKVMAHDNYAEFFLALEMGPHDIIPMGIRGDFTSFTAPNDPIFYLHHSQLDRVWWLWQQRDKADRVHNYGGEGDNGKNVTLTDTLPLAGLDADLTVADIMDTEGGEMCYRYMFT